MSLCPCGSGREFTACCDPVLNDAASAGTAEALMRARYTAYTLGDIDFVMNTTHPSTRDQSDREAMEAWAKSAQWSGLEILGTRKGTAQDNEGTVEFQALFTLNGVAQKHHELSTFQKENGQWFFFNGEERYSGPAEKPKPVVRDIKLGRNDPCHCGSGKKFKKCCGA